MSLLYMCSVYNTQKHAAIYQHIYQNSEEFLMIFLYLLIVFKKKHRVYFKGLIFLRVVLRIKMVYYEHTFLVYKYVGSKAHNLVWTFTTFPFTILLIALALNAKTFVPSARFF